MNRSKAASVGEVREEKRSAITTIMLALLFIAWVGEWPLELDPVMYSGLWRSPFDVFGPMFEPLPGIRLFPWQLILIAMVPFCLALPGALTERAGALDRAMVVSASCIVVTVLWGQIKGGSLYFAYYQVWRFVAALLFAYVFVAALRSKGDLVALAKLIIVAALIRATLVVYFYWEHIYGKVSPLPEYMTNHDDSLLFVMALLIIGGWAMLKGGKWVWLATTVVSLYLAYAIVLNDRRIAWVELVMAAAAIYLMIGPGPIRSRINRAAMSLLPVLIVYVAVGWGREGALFAPIQSISSVKGGDDPSSLTRQEELRNLLYTLAEKGNPIFGTGWGVPYDIVERVWSNYPAEWVLVPYTPHNSLVGLAVFSGMVGIIGIWGVVPIAALLAVRAYRRSEDITVRLTAMVSLGTLVAFGVHCYGDIGLQSFACCTMFAAALATASKVSAWTDADRIHDRSRSGRSRSGRARAQTGAAVAENGRDLSKQPALRRSHR